MFIVSYLVMDSPIQSRHSHLVFLLREVVLRPYSGFLLVGGGLLVTEVILDLL